MLPLLHRGENSVQVEPQTWLSDPVHTSLFLAFVLIRIASFDGIQHDHPRLKR